MSYTIESAKIKKGPAKVKHECIEAFVTRHDEKGARHKGLEFWEAPPHPDLLTAFENLNIHLAVMLGFVPVDRVKNIKTPDEKLIEGFNVRAFSLGGNEDAPGVVISGNRILNTGKVVNGLNSPFTRFNESEQTRYPFMEDLEEKLERLNKELRAYLEGEKRGADAQLTMDFNDGEPVTKASISVPADQAPIERDLGRALWEAEGSKTDAVIKSIDDLPGAKLPGLSYANPEAMARILEGDKEPPADPAPAPKKGRGRPPKQTQENPGGLDQRPGDSAPVDPADLTELPM